MKRDKKPLETTTEISAIVSEDGKTIRLTPRSLQEHFDYVRKWLQNAHNDDFERWITEDVGDEALATRADTRTIFTHLINKVLFHPLIMAEMAEKLSEQTKVEASEVNQEVVLRIMDSALQSYLTELEETIKGTSKQFDSIPLDDVTAQLVTGMISYIRDRLKFELTTN